MSSESTQTGYKVTSGFSEEHIAAFMQLGNTQGGAPIAQEFSTLTPTQQMRVDSLVITGKSKFAGDRKEVGRQETSTGFMGQFSDITPDQLDAYVKVFENRRQVIADKKRAPGRDQLFLVGR